MWKRTLRAIFALACAGQSIVASAADMAQDVIKTWEDPGKWQLIIQRGRYECPEGEHFAIGVDSGIVEHGCATETSHDGWIIDWKGGGSLTIPGERQELGPIDLNRPGLARHVPPRIGV